MHMKNKNILNRIVAIVAQLGTFTKNVHLRRWILWDAKYTLLAFKKAAGGEAEWDRAGACPCTECEEKGMRAGREQEECPGRCCSLQLYIIPFILLIAGPQVSDRRWALGAGRTWSPGSASHCRAGQGSHGPKMESSDHSGASLMEGRLQAPGQNDHFEMWKLFSW